MGRKTRKNLTLRILCLHLPNKSNAQNKIENRANLLVKEGNKIILIAEKVNNIGNLTAPKGEILGSFSLSVVNY